MVLFTGGAVRAQAPGGYRSGPGPKPGLSAARRARVVYDELAWYTEGRRIGRRQPFALVVKDLADEIIRRKLAVPEREPTARYARLLLSVRRMKEEEFRPRKNVAALWLTMTLTLVEKPEPIAEELIDEILDRFRTMLVERHKGYVRYARERIPAAEAKLKADRAELDKLVALEKKLRKQVSGGLDREEVSHQLKEYGRLAGTLSLELAGKEARLRETLRQIQKVKLTAEVKGAKDPVIGELEKLVGLRDREVTMQRELVKRGVANVASVQTAEGKLAEAKVRLIERRESVVEMAGGTVLAKLNEELAMLGLDTVELAAKQKRIGEMLADLRHQHDQDRLLRETVVKIEVLRIAIAKSEGEPAKLTQHLKETEPPTLTVPNGPKTQPAAGSGAPGPEKTRY
jgi:hypothetical protein